MFKAKTMLIVIALQPLFACGDGLSSVRGTESNQEAEAPDLIEQLDIESQNILKRYMQIFSKRQLITRDELYYYHSQHSEAEYAATLLEMCGANKKLFEIDRYDEVCAKKIENMEYSRSDASRFINLLQRTIGQQEDWEILSVTGEKNDRIFKIIIQYGDHELGVNLIVDSDLQDVLGKVAIFKIDGILTQDIVFD